MKLKVMVGAIVVLCFAAGMGGVHAAQQKAGGRGSVNGMFQFFSQDILYLESEISALMTECGKELNR